MRKLMLVQLCIAIVMLIMSVVVAARPYLLMDVVLTNEQLADQATHDEVLQLMQRANGNSSAWWLILGLAIGCIALMGLRSSPERAN